MNIHASRYSNGVLLLVVAVLTLGFTGFTGCGNKSVPKAQPHITPSATPSNNAAISQVKGHYTEALGKAKDWQKNATLERIYRTYDGTFTPSEPAPLVFAFASLADPKTTLEIAFSGDNVTNHKVSKKPFELLFNPINAGEWEVDPNNALTIAEKSGGERFREKHLAGYAVLQQLSKAGAHNLQWYVRYDTGDGSRLRYEIYINARTGIVDSMKEIRR